MPRKKLKSIRLTARLSENTSSLEDLSFVEQKLKSMNQATLIREAVSIYRKYEEGELFKEVFTKFKLNEIPLLDEKKEIPQKIRGLDKKLKEGSWF